MSLCESPMWILDIPKAFTLQHGRTFFWKQFQTSRCFSVENCRGEDSWIFMASRVSWRAIHEWFVWCQDGQALPKSVESFALGNGFPDQNEFKMKFGVSWSLCNQLSYRILCINWINSNQNKTIHVRSIHHRLRSSGCFECPFMEQFSACTASLHVPSKRLHSGSEAVAFVEGLKMWQGSKCRWTLSITSSFGSPLRLLYRQRIPLWSTIFGTWWCPIEKPARSIRMMK